MTLFDEMSLPELEAFAVELHAQINHGRPQWAQIALEDVKSWIAVRKREIELCPDPPSFIVNLF